MMGERQVAQEALFYEFSLERHVRPIIGSAPSTGLSTSQICARICARSTARQVALRSIRS